MHYEQIRVKAEKIFSNDISTLFNAEILHDILRDAKVESTANTYLSMLQGHSFKVTRDLAPRIHQITTEVREKLDFQEDIEFFIESAPDLNCAAMFRMDEDQPHVVIINSALVDRFTDEELRFVLGHELGHLVSRNSELRRIINWIYPLGTNMSTILQDKIETWEKLAELSADRFGYIAAPDYEICLQVFFKLSSGLDTDRIAFVPAAYRESMDAILEQFKKNGGAGSSTHPINPVRLKALDHFRNSGLYKLVTAGKDPKQDEDLTTAMEPLMEIILDRGLTPLMHHRKRVIATGGMIIAHADGEIAKEELEKTLSGLAHSTHFPRKLLDEIMSEGEIGEIFAKSVNAVLEANPIERYSMFTFLVDVAVADKKLQKKEVDLLYEIGENIFGFQLKEMAQMIADTLQKEFIPNILGVSD